MIGIRNLKRLCIVVVVIGLWINPVFAAAPSLDAWKPSFDPAGAKYKCIVSNVSHPVLKGVYTGFAIRDELWKRSNGQIYIDYKPFSMLGGEVEVLNQLQMGAIQGMGVSSVASTNLGPRFGVVNLPFLVDSFEKLDKFINSGQLFDHFLMAMDHQGIMALDITGYGNYGWATTTPVKTIDDAKKAKFRIAEAVVVLVVCSMLAGHWLPLGPEKGLLRNGLFTVGLVALFMLGFRFFQYRYAAVLRWCLDHKKSFLTMPLFVLLLGGMVWQGASPLGEEPTRMIPAAISGGNPKVVAMAKPTMGMMVNWQTSPMRTPLGILITPAKSRKLIWDPIPNMMICNRGTMVDFS